MTITWDIDEARAVIRAQMAEANRLDEVIDDLLAETSAAIARAEAAEATLASCNRARQAAEAECERLRALLKEVVGEEPPMDSREALMTR